MPRSQGLHSSLSSLRKLDWWFGFDYAVSEEQFRDRISSEIIQDSECLPTSSSVYAASREWSSLLLRSRFTAAPHASLLDLQVLSWASQLHFLSVLPQSLPEESMAEQMHTQLNRLSWNSVDPPVDHIIVSWSHLAFCRLSCPSDLTPAEIPHSSTSALRSGPSLLQLLGISSLQPVGCRSHQH